MINNTRITLMLERPVEGFDGGVGLALARVIEAHPVLADLLDFVSVDPRQVAVEVGMVYPYEEDGADDLGDIEFDPYEWFEPSAGLVVVRRAVDALRADPLSLARAIYDPSLGPAKVIADLETLERALFLAQQHETRFHLVLAGGN